MGEKGGRRYQEYQVTDRCGRSCARGIRGGGRGGEGGRRREEEERGEEDKTETEDKESQMSQDCPGTQ